MEPGTAGEGYGDRLAAELARVRDAIDDLRRRPIPLDAATLRHVVTASLSEASAPPPNLLVTAIRRLDRIDARLESIESALGGPAALPRGQVPGGGRGRAPAVIPQGPVSYSPAPDPEAIAEALARRLVGVLSSPAPPGRSGGASVDDLLAALRPLVPGAARSVLRRSGREPSPQAVEVLQQTALIALEEAAGSLGRVGAPPPFSTPVDPRRLAGPPAALAPAPAPPPPPPLNVEALAAVITSRVTAALAAELRQAPGPVAEAAPPEPEPPQPPPPPPLDPAVVAEAVISRLTEQPPPQAVLSAMAMAPLLSAVGNVEAAVARIAEPDANVVVVVGRLQAGIEALIQALEEDRSVQAQMQQGFAEVTELVRAELSERARAGADHDIGDGPEPSGGDGSELVGGDEDGDRVAGPGLDRVQAALTGVQRRLDRLSRELAPLTDFDLGSTVPGLAAQGQRLERSMGHILTALAAVAEHLQEQSSTWRSRFDDLQPAPGTPEPPGPAEADLLARELGKLARRVDELVAGTAADRQRFQRLGGTIEGLAELLGQVSERLDRIPRVLARPLSPQVEAQGAATGAGLATGPVGGHREGASLVGSRGPAAPAGPLAGVDGEGTAAIASEVPAPDPVSAAEAEPEPQDRVEVDPHGPVRPASERDETSDDAPMADAGEGREAAGATVDHPAAPEPGATAHGSEAPAAAGAGELSDGDGGDAPDGDGDGDGNHAEATEVGEAGRRRRRRRAGRGKRRA